ncbi:MAG: JAB domain-containing protein [Limosilactobacillus pontis]|nr:JAB domain-containing protein [Limosilactobacillus pontis]
MNEYQELLRYSIPNATIGDEPGYRYILDHYPTPLALREMTEDERISLCQGSTTLTAFFAAVQLGELLARAHPAVEGYAYSSMELGQAMIDHFTGDEQESVCVAFTNVHNEIIKFKRMFIGGCSECVLYPDQIFKQALRCSASGLVMIHNHPSGDVKPSAQDLAFAKRLEQGGHLLGIQVLDFMIVGHDCYYSWREQQH